VLQLRIPFIWDSVICHSIFAAQCSEATTQSQNARQQTHIDITQYLRRMEFWELTHFLSILMVKVEGGDYFNSFPDRDGKCESLLYLLFYYTWCHDWSHLYSGTADHWFSSLVSLMHSNITAKLTHCSQCTLLYVKHIFLTWSLCVRGSSFISLN
jgi:hypothetical protein